MEKRMGIIDTLKEEAETLDKESIRLLKEARWYLNLSMALLIIAGIALVAGMVI